MTVITKKAKLLFITALLGLLVTLLIVSFTEVCTLRAVTVDGQTMEKWNKKLPLEEDKSILRQPLDDFVSNSLADDKTLKLDYKYSWPHTLNIKLNYISPVCLLLDRNSATLYGLDENARVMPLKPELVDWERPVITGIRIRKVYQCPAEIRLRKVLPALDKLRREETNFYRLIEQVDFAADDFVGVTVAGQAHTVRVRAEYFYDDMNRYVDFVARYQPQLEGIKIIDIRQNGQIITKGKKA